MRSVTRRALTLAAAATAGIVAACKDTTAPAAQKTMSLSFAGTAVTAPVRAPAGMLRATSAISDTLVQVSGADTLKITGAWVVLRRVSLERIEGGNANCDTMPEHSAVCEDFTMRDLLVTLPLVAGVQTSLNIQVDSGHYESVHFKIHKPANDSIDIAFKTANPGFDTISVKVTGLFNNVPFTFISRLDAEQEYDFVPPLVVDASGTATNLTIRMDLALWFKNAGTGALIGPATANPGGANEGIVTQNIKNSIKAFEDRNENNSENH